MKGKVYAGMGSGWGAVVLDMFLLLLVLHSELFNYEAMLNGDDYIVMKWKW